IACRYLCPITGWRIDTARRLVQSPLSILGRWIETCPALAGAVLPDAPAPAGVSSSSELVGNERTLRFFRCPWATTRSPGVYPPCMRRGLRSAPRFDTDAEGIVSLADVFAFYQPSDAMMGPESSRSKSVFRKFYFRPLRQKRPTHTRVKREDLVRLIQHLQ